MKNLTEGKPLKIILQFALPLLIGQLFQLFYSLADTRIVGETLGEQALAAVGATSTLSDLLLSLLMGLLNGFGIVTATYFGAKDEENTKKAIANTFLFGTGAALLVSMISLLFLPQILRFLNIQADLFADACSYISILLAGLVTAALYHACAAILRAIGDSFTPLLFLILSSILNIILDYSFILYFHLGTAGAALATVLSQAVSAVLCFLYMRMRCPQLNPAKKDFLPNTDVYKKLLTTGISMAFMSAFVQLGTFSLQTAINVFGTATIVAHAAARKASSIFMMPWSVLGTTLATFCGQNLGAGKYDRIKKGLRDTLFLTWGWSVCVIFVTYTRSPQLICAITATTEPEIIRTAVLYLKVNTPFYFVPSVICLFRNAMQGFGDSKTPVFSSALELLVKIAAAFLFAPAIGYWGIILAEPAAWFIMVVPLVINTLKNPIFQK